MPSKKEPPIDIVALAFDELAAHGWRHFSLTSVAERAGKPLADVYAQIRSRTDLWRVMADRLDKVTFSIDIAELGPLSARERLFELIMRRIDGLEAYRPAIERMRQDRVQEPSLAPLMFCRLDRLAEQLLDATGATLSGLRRHAARRLLMVTYGRVFWVWLGDTSEDRAATMAELDKRLNHLDKLARWTANKRRRESRAEAPDPDTTHSDAG